MSSTKSFACSVCEKGIFLVINAVFSRQEHLKRHHRTHTGEKPFRCPRSELNCFRLFSRKDQVLRHLRRKHKENIARLGENDIIVIGQESQQPLPHIFSAPRFTYPLETSLPSSSLLFCENAGLDLEAIPPTLRPHSVPLPSVYHKQILTPRAHSVPEPLLYKYPHSSLSAINTMVAPVSPSIPVDRFQVLYDQLFQVPRPSDK